MSGNARERLGKETRGRSRTKKVLAESDLVSTRMNPSTSTRGSPGRGRPRGRPRKNLNPLQPTYVGKLQEELGVEASYIEDLLGIKLEIPSSIAEIVESPGSHNADDDDDDDFDTFNRFYCRLCAKKQYNVISAFGNEGELWELIEKIARCLPIIVLPHDELPTSICHSCLEKLNTCYDLIETSVQAETVLKCKLAILKSNMATSQVIEDPNEADKDFDDETRSEYEDSVVPADVPLSKLQVLNTGNIQQGQRLRTTKIPIDDEDDDADSSAFNLEGPAKCEICSVVFVNMDAFDSHMEMHFKKNKFECQFCFLTFGVYKDLIIHKTKTHQGELVSCEDCKCIRAVQGVQSDEDSENEFQCKLCGMQGKSKVQMQRHYFTHLPRTVVCNICGKKCTSLFKYRFHKKMHNQMKKMIKCDVCDKEFESRFLLNRHKLYLCRVAPFTCSICGEIFLRQVSLQLHVRRHSEEKPFQCQYCERKFAYLSHLNVHTRSHFAPRHACDVCSKTFQSLTNLSRHRSIHDPSAHDRFKCGVCDRPFRLKRQLKQHEITHTNLKPHLCDICGRGFNRKANMVNHRALHFKEKPSKCMYCAETFRTRLDLRIHVGCSHPELRLSGTVPYSRDRKRQAFKCEYCGKMLASKNSLTDHERIHTGELPFVCKACGRRFRALSLLYQHMPIHTGVKHHLCSLCGKKFARKSFLNIHMRHHSGEKPYCCSICGTKFSQRGDMTRHYRRHTGEVPYRCDQCDAGFFLRRLLNEHKENHSHEKYAKVTYIVQNMLGEIKIETA